MGIGDTLISTETMSGSPNITAGNSYVVTGISYTDTDNGTLTLVTINDDTNTSVQLPLNFFQS